MGNAVSSLDQALLTKPWMARSDPSVHECLGNATADSLHETLTSKFYEGPAAFLPLPAIRSAESKTHIKDIFESYGSVNKNDEIRYWSEVDLECFLSSHFPGCDALNPSIPILWRCFHFWAYFPLPKKPSQRLDYSAFMRAVAFLAADGISRLGNDVVGAAVNADQGSDVVTHEVKGLRRMFRSLAARSSQVEPSQANVLVTEDIIGVLALVQPSDYYKISIPREELRPHANSILASSGCHACVYTSIPRQDLLNLLKLLLSLQIDKPKWGAHFSTAHTASIDPECDNLDEIANVLLSHFILQGETDVGWQTFRNVLSIYLPNLFFQFRLIFTAFISLSPSPIDQIRNLPQSTSTISLPQAQYLSFFYPLVSNRTFNHQLVEHHRAEVRYNLQNPEVAYSAFASSLSIEDFATALGPLRVPTMLLVTGDAIATSTEKDSIHPHAPVTFGAYMPTPWDVQRLHEYKAGSAHMLFQLEPRHELLRPISELRVRDLLSTGNDKEKRTKGWMRFGPNGGTGLHVDFDNGIATFKSLTATGGGNVEKDEFNKAIVYRDVGTATECDARARGWETSMRIEKLEVYRLTGPVSWPLQKQVDEREFAKRIQGFGSGG